MSSSAELVVCNSTTTKVMHTGCIARNMARIKSPTTNTRHHQQLLQTQGPITSPSHCHLLAVVVILQIDHHPITVRRHLRQSIQSIPSSSHHHLLTVVGTQPESIPSPSRHHLLATYLPSHNNSQVTALPPNTTNYIIITSPSNHINGKMTTNPITITSPSPCSSISPPAPTELQTVWKSLSFMWMIMLSLQRP